MCVAYFLRRRLQQRLHPARQLLLQGMAGYLSESDFVMVEEGFSTRDLLKELTLGASEATTVRGWEWGWVPVPCTDQLPSQEGSLGPSSYPFTYLVRNPCYLQERGSIYPQFLVLAPKPPLLCCLSTQSSKVRNRRFLSCCPFSLTAHI